MAVDEYPTDTVKVCLHRNFSAYADHYLVEEYRSWLA